MPQYQNDWTGAASGREGVHACRSLEAVTGTTEGNLHVIYAPEGTFYSRWLVLNGNHQDIVLYEDVSSSTASITVIIIVPTVAAAENKHIVTMGLFVEPALAPYSVG